MLRGEVALALEGLRSHGGMALLEEFSPRGTGLSGHAFQGLSGNDARNDCWQIWAWGTAFPHACPGLRLLEDLSCVSNLYPHGSEYCIFSIDGEPGLINPNFEYRNPKQFRSSNDQILKTN